MLTHRKFVRRLRLIRCEIMSKGLAVPIFTEGSEEQKGIIMVWTYMSTSPAVMPA